MWIDCTITDQATTWTFYWCICLNRQLVGAITGLGLWINSSLFTFLSYLTPWYPTLFPNWLELSSALYILLIKTQQSKMPSATSSNPPPSIRGGHEKARPRATEPLAYSGSLDSYEQHDTTPSIGREIPTLQMNKILNSTDADTLIRDLAITGRVFSSTQHTSTS